MPHLLCLTRQSDQHTKNGLPLDYRCHRSATAFSSIDAVCDSDETMPCVLRGLKQQQSASAHTTKYECATTPNKIRVVLVMHYWSSSMCVVPLPARSLLPYRRRPCSWCIAYRTHTCLERGTRVLCADDASQKPL